MAFDGLHDDVFFIPSSFTRRYSRKSDLVINVNILLSNELCLYVGKNYGFITATNLNVMLGCEFNVKSLCETGCRSSSKAFVHIIKNETYQ